MFQLLIEYKIENRHTLVLQDYPKNPALGRWVSLQRSMYAKNELMKYRRLSLDSIKFV